MDDKYNEIREECKRKYKLVRERKKKMIRGHEPSFILLWYFCVCVITEVVSIWVEKLCVFMRWRVMGRPIFILYSFRFKYVQRKTRDISSSKSFLLKGVKTQLMQYIKLRFLSTFRTFTWVKSGYIIEILFLSPLQHQLYIS